MAQSSEIRTVGATDLRWAASSGKGSVQSMDLASACSRVPKTADWSVESWVTLTDGGSALLMAVLTVGLKDGQLASPKVALKEGLRAASWEIGMVGQKDG